MLVREGTVIKGRRCSHCGWCWYVYISKQTNWNEIRICPWTSVWIILWCFNYLKLDKSIKLMWSVNYCLRINRHWRAYSSGEYMRNEKHSVLVEKAVSISETPLGLMNCLTSIWNEEISLKKVKRKIVASLVMYYLACVCFILLLRTCLLLSF